MTKTRILVGAGLAGLATARTLARAGFSAEVVERQPAWDDAGRVSGLRSSASCRTSAVSCSTGPVGLSSAVDYSKHEYKTVVADLLDGALDALGLDRAHLGGAP